jgi:hypothetical protein
MYGIQPIEFFSINDFAGKPEWEILNGSSAVLHFVLTKTDSLGTRRHLLPSGQTVALAFVRARAASVGSQAVTLTKTCTALTEDKSIYTVTLSIADVAQVLSGGLQLVISAAGLETKVNIPYVVKKISSSPGF